MYCASLNSKRGMYKAAYHKLKISISSVLDGEITNNVNYGVEQLLWVTRYEIITGQCLDFSVNYFISFLDITFI